MAVDLRKETYSALSRRPAQIMQIPIKEDVIVPDSKPDVGRILQTGVRFAPEESTLEGQRIRFGGKLEFTVLYLGDGDSCEVHSMKTSVTVDDFLNVDGLPPEADLVLDVRCLPNPFYVPELKHKTGLDQEVVDFVMNHPEAKQLLDRYEQFLQVALPLYVKEGKSQLTIAVGCTGGKHRSITFARKIAEYCTSLGYEPGVQHRDAMR